MLHQILQILTVLWRSEYSEEKKKPVHFLLKSKS